MRVLAIVAMGFALAAAADVPAVEQVADALAAGEAATGKRAQASAAERLVRLGARPMDGEPDLAALWTSGRRPTAYRDRILGPVYRGLTLDPGASVQFEQSFYAGRTARVAVAALDPLAVSLQVFDDEGRQRCSGGGARCEWVPAWTGRARIELRNRGDRRGRFFVVVQ